MRQGASTIKAPTAAIAARSNVPEGFKPLSEYKLANDRCGYTAANAVLVKTRVDALPNVLTLAENNR